MSENIASAKQRLPLPALMHQLGLGDHAKKSAKCPFHDDKHNSFSAWQNNGAWFFKCHAGCGEGDEINFLELHENLSRRDATKRFLNLAGLNDATPPRSTTTSTTTVDWQKCVDALPEKHLEWLSDWRGYSGEFCSWLHKRGLVGLYDGCVAFPVHNNGKIVGAHFRLETGAWNYTPKGIRAAPLVFGKITTGDTVHVFESQWDAFAFMYVSGTRDGIIITRGASNGALVADVIPESATAYLWPQNDAPGQKWAKDVCAHTKCAVKSAKTPTRFADLNAWTKDGGATDKDLLDAMMSAEVVREPEKSWDDALAESEVTATELHDLKLTPRKKLLGDWFAEGDCGFIFAFRGTGKTWLAVAMANALATGGKLGDWQAPESVKVLYIDSEMPPDLMRDRCDGLGTASNLRLINHDILFERTGKVLNIANREIQEAITKRCVNTGVKVLFIDNLSTAAFGMRENEADSWEQVNPWLLDLRRRKIAVVIIHHAGRSGEMRGTSKREDAVFWIIALDDMKKDAEDKRGARFISRFTKPSRNTQEEIPAYQWHFVTEASGEVSVACKPAQSLDVFRSVMESGVTKPAEIAEVMKVEGYVVSRLAKKAEQTDWFTKGKRGDYELVKGKT